MITALTAEQEAQLPVYRDKWIKIGLCTDPADRPRAEAGIAKAYEVAGLEPPETIVWLKSPMAGCIAAAWLDADALDQPVWRELKEQVQRLVTAYRDEHALTDEVWAQVHEAVWSRVWTHIVSQIKP